MLQTKLGYVSMMMMIMLSSSSLCIWAAETGPTEQSTTELDKEGQYISEKFSNGFHFETYAEFEAFFQNKLPQYNQEIRTKSKRPNTPLISSPIYAYASYEFDIEPVKKLYNAFYKSGQTLEAMKNIDRLWRNGDERFKLLTKPTVIGFLKAIVWNHLQGLAEKVFARISNDSMDFSFYQQIKNNGVPDYQLTPKMERLQSEMCNLLSACQYQNLASEVADSEPFDCDETENLRQFLRQYDEQPREVMSKLAKYVVSVYKRNKSIDKVNDDNLTQADIEREQPHHKFARDLKQQLEPIFGVLNLATRMLNANTDTDNDDSFQRFKERYDSLLSKSQLVEYWYLAYQISDLVLSIRFGKSRN